MKEIKIALIGSAPSSVNLSPYGSPDWQIWACSPGAYGIIRKPNAWFELHKYEPGQPWFSPEYCQWMSNLGCPVFMAEKRPEIPNSVAVNVEDLVNKYGPYFFTSSLAYMFAMAIDAGATKIGLWGVDMAATEEYGYQRAGCQYFAMLARAKGIEVGVPPESDLLRPPPLYGVSELDHARIKFRARRAELTQRVQNAQKRMEDAKQEFQFVMGALDDLTWHENTWHGTAGKISQQFVEPPVVPALQNGEEVGGGMTWQYPDPSEDPENTEFQIMPNEISTRPGAVLTSRNLSDFQDISPSEKLAKKQKKSPKSKAKSNGLEP